MTTDEITPVGPSHALGTPELGVEVSSGCRGVYKRLAQFITICHCLATVKSVEGGGSREEHLARDNCEETG